LRVAIPPLQREKKEPTKEGSHTKRLLGLERK